LQGLEQRIIGFYVYRRDIEYFDPNIHKEILYDIPQLDYNGTFSEPKFVMRGGTSLLVKRCQLEETALIKSSLARE
jgi:hypothetical protein